MDYSIGFTEAEVRKILRIQKGELKKTLADEGRPVSVIQSQIEADLQNMAYWDLLVLMGRHLCELAKQVGCDLNVSLLNDIAHFFDEREMKTETTNYGELNVKGGVSVSTPKLISVLNIFASLSSEFSDMTIS